MEGQLSIWEEQRNPRVIMHNDLIVAQFGNLEMAEMRIFLIMLAKVEWGINQLGKVRVSLRDIDPNIVLTDTNEHFKRAIAAGKKLRNKMGNVEILWEENGKKKWRNTAIIQDILYTEGTDYVECTWGENMAPYLINLKGNFTTEELSELLKLKSVHAIRLYMLVKSLWRVNQVYVIGVNQLRKMLFGDEKMYPEYKILKRDVLSTAMKALEKTHSAFRIEEVKKGRFVDSVVIIPQRTKIDLKPFSKDIEELLHKYRVSAKKIRYMYANGEITEDFIRLTFEKCFKEVNPCHPEVGGFIFEAIVEKKYLKEYQRWKAGSGAVPAKKSLADTPFKQKKEFISLEDLKQMHQRSLARNTQGPKDLEAYINEIFITVGYEVEYGEAGMIGIFKMQTI